MREKEIKNVLIQRELKNKEDKNYSNLPLVTIITVVFNAVDLIENTIKSVIEQTYTNVEYIIVDGGSTDGTLDIIQKYEDKISYWISEKDKGIYDAMNKGIQLSHGDWINFMNAGDSLYEKNTIKKVMEWDDVGYDLIYGDAFQIVEKKIVHAPQNLDNLWKGTGFGHESMFIKSSIMRNNKYNLKYRVAADYDFIMKCYYAGYKFKKASVTILAIAPMGYSNKYWLRSCFENWSIVRSYNKNIKVDIYFFFTNLFTISVKILKWLVPNRIYKFVHKVYHYRF